MGRLAAARVDEGQAEGQIFKFCSPLSLPSLPLSPGSWVDHYPIAALLLHEEGNHPRTPSWLGRARLVNLKHYTPHLHRPFFIS